MDRNQIEKLTADELRLEIAKAKGWQRTHIDLLTAFPPDCKDFSIHNLRPFPQWTTKIAAAWELVEEIPENHIVQLFRRYVTADYAGGLWLARIINGTNSHSVEATADTAPIAICRARLMWKPEA